MKIAIVSLHSRFADTAYDCVQAEKTDDALYEIGVDSGCFCCKY